MWDRRRYCRKCVEDVSPKLYEFIAVGSSLNETVSREDVSATRYFFRIGKSYLIGICLIFGLPVGFLVLAGKVPVEGLFFILAFFGGGGIFFIMLASFIGASTARSRLPRITSVQDGDVCIATPNHEERVRLTDCKWYFGKTEADQLCLFTQLRNGVVIQTPNLHVACGYTAESLEHWRSFLTLARVPQNPPYGCLRLIVIASLGMLVGLPIGAIIGYGVSLLTNNIRWVPALGFTAAVEGAFVALIYATCTSEGSQAARERLHPILVGLPFLTAGIFVGMLGGWKGALIFGSTNALFGVLVALVCRRKIGKAELP